MEDLDLKEFFKKIIIWGIIVVVFGSLFAIILLNKFGGKDIRINKKIDSKEKLYVLVVNSKGKNIQQIKRKLKSRNISYEIVYKDKERYYSEFLNKLSLSEEEIIEPTILYIENGQAKSSLVEIKDVKTIDKYLDELTE